MNSHHPLWQACLSTLEQTLPEQQFKTWIKPLTADITGTEKLRLLAPNRFTIDFIKDRFVGVIQSSLAAHLGHEMIIEFGLISNQTPTPRPAPHAPEPTQSSHLSSRALGNPQETSRLNTSYTFDTLVTGKANQIARAAAQQIAEHPGQGYNPFFVYGGSGLGKTHLIHAIGNAIYQRNPQAKVRYISAERYVQDFIKAVRNKSFDELKRLYYGLDLLLIDDIQFLSNKTGCQEEFFYTFNALIEAGKQIIITCDTFPKEIQGMEDRLISRFGSGLTVAIEPPELEMRVAILTKKADSEHIWLDESVAFFIAQNIYSNVRELEGALKRVTAYAKFTNQPITVEVTREALRDTLAIVNKQLTIDVITKTVTEYYRIKLSELYSKKRTRNLARPRQIAMSLAKELTNMSLPSIGDHFGGRDHTTVLHACRTINDMRATDAELKRDYETLLQMLKN